MTATSATTPMTGNYTGDDSDNVVTGSSDDNIFDGGKGDDTLTGGAGEDRLEGGRGDDTLEGGEGKDTLFAGIGNDTLTGGKGRDTFVFSVGPNSGNKTIADFTIGEDIIALSDLSLIDFDSLDISQDGEDALIKYYGRPTPPNGFSPAARAPRWSPWSVTRVSREHRARARLRRCNGRERRAVGVPPSYSVASAVTHSGPS